MQDIVEYMRAFATGELPETGENELNVLEKMWWEKEKKSISNEVARYVNKDPLAHPLRVEEKTIGDHLKESVYSVGISILDRRI